MIAVYALFGHCESLKLHSAGLTHHQMPSHLVGECGPSTVQKKLRPAKKSRSNPTKRRVDGKGRKSTYPTVHARELSSVRMVGHNENKFSKVVDDNEVKQWVGFGWVGEGPAQSPRDDKLPRVIRG